MAQSGYTPIQLYYSTTAAAVPIAGNLTSGELAINITDGKLYYKNNSGTVTLLAGSGGGGPAAGSNTQLQFNSSGVFGASANLTWDGTTLSSTQVNITGQGTLRLQDTTGGEYVGLRSPGTLSASYTLTFPADDGTSGQALITDGSGVLSWSTAASGDVYGPASATDNAVARFDSTTGKLLQNSVVLIGDTGAVTGVTDLTTSGYVKVGTFSAVTGALTSFVSSSGGIYSYYTGGSGYIASYSDNSGTFSPLVFDGSYLAWRPAGTEQMRLTSGLLTVTPGATIQGLTVGRGAGAVATNTAVGKDALAANTSGANNTAVGTSALQTNTTASNNTALGYQAGYTITTNGDATAIGYRALYLNTIGGNAAVGSLALTNNSTGAGGVAMGYGALQTNTTGSSNTGLGYLALNGNTTGSNNVSVGYQSLYSNTQSNNTAIGYQAAYANTSGSGITAIGSQVLSANTTGSANVGVGGTWTSNVNGALIANTTGNYNVAMGVGALQANTTASNNTAVGYQAALLNTTGANNVAVGYQSLDANTTASGNTAIGASALQANTTASQNTAVGYQAGYSNTTAQYSTFIGYESGLNSNRTADTNGYNTFVGYRSGLNVSTGQVSVFIGSRSGTSGASRITGSGNTSVGDFSGNALEGAAALNAFFGQNSGASVTTGTKNTIIGSYTGNSGGLDIRTASNYIVLSDGDGNVRLISDNSGNVLVGAAATSSYFDGKLNVFNAGVGASLKNNVAVLPPLITWNAATSGDNKFVTFTTETSATERGTISYNRAGGLTAYNTTSDYRAKDISGPVINSGALIDSVPVYMGTMKGATQERPMFIAHETPAYAHTGEKDAVDADGNPVYQQMDASALIPVMWAEIQSLRKRLADAGL